MVTSALAGRVIAETLPFVHLWRVVLTGTTLTHEREHPALALLILVPLNHFLYTLTASLDPPRPRALAPARIGRAGLVVGLHLAASIGLILWYGSWDALLADVRVFSRTWEWWGLVVTLVALNVLYRPLVRSLHHLVGAAGLLDSRLWSALFLAIAVWLWCDGVFAALYQQLSLYCESSAAEWCEGGQVFSQSLASFVDAAYFSTITLSTTGYGDIVPVADIARALVAIEIVIGFGLLGFLLSRVAGYVAPAAESGVGKAGERRPEEDADRAGGTEES
jgi:hypothetical protein